jgi:hypothetical protein
MTAPALRWREKRRTRQLMLALAFAIVILIGALLESSKVERRRKLAEQEHWDQDDDVVIKLQSEDQSSSNIENSNDDLVEYFGTSFRVVGETAATDELQIEILNPKPKFQYSVTIEAPRKYTGTATLISSQHDGKMVYSWRPSFASTYVILVHELERNRYGPHVKTPLVQPSPLSITIGTNQTKGLDSLKERAQKMIPCQSVNDTNVFSTFDGDWIGPDINVGGDTLRTGWTFLPTKTMNCKFETFSYEDVLSLPEKKSIYVIGTSKERGVFLSLVDLLLSSDEKLNINKSVAAQCWGRVNVTKGNFELVYQDFRVAQFELENTEDYIECHNDLIAKDNGKFIDNATAVWHELFQDESSWPSVILMLSGKGGNNWNFDYHTRSFVETLPPSWNGTLIFTDGYFSPQLGGLSARDVNEKYSSKLEEYLQTMNDHRVRWINGKGLSKEMRMYAEFGPEFVTRSQHFHRFCNENILDDSTGNTNNMRICGNITDLMAQLLLGYTLGEKGPYLEKIHQQPPVETKNITLSTCWDCPKKLLPFHITPNPLLSCAEGPLNEREKVEDDTSTEHTCPQVCMNQDISWKFGSQSDVVEVRQCLVSILDSETSSESPVTVVPSALDDKSVQLPKWIETNLADVSEEDQTSFTPFFWHIPKCAGTAIQNLYFCMGLTLANQVGANPNFGHEEETALVEFKPWKRVDWSVINVDTTTKEGILRAQEMGLVQSKEPRVHLVVSGEFDFASEHLFDGTHRGRVFSMFKHPVRRLESLFYYLQKATWETTYHPEWKDISLVDWGKQHKGEKNWIVHKLVNKSVKSLTLDDLELAKKIVREKILVGLEDKFAESIHRFNIYSGIDDSSDERQSCISSLVKEPKDGDKRASRARNADPHPKVEKGSEVWNILAKDSLDVLLYEYIEELYEQQGEVIEMLKMKNSS